VRVGPLLGGYFTDHGTVGIRGARHCRLAVVFYLNVPLGLVALFMVIVKMPKLSHDFKGSIDYVGALLIVGACVPLLLALTFGGQKYPWGSPVVLGLSSMFVVFTILFVFNEKRVSDPDHPYGIVRQQSVRVGKSSGLLLIDVVLERGGLSAACSCSLDRACKPPPAGWQRCP